MKMKKILALLLCVATMFTLVSAEVFAASYTLTVKSNDGAQTLFTASVQSGEEIIFTSEGLVTDSDIYTYAGEKDFVGFHTSSGKTVVTYTNGMTYTVAGNLTLYLVEGEKTAHTIVGDSVPGATSYELYEVGEELKLHDGYSYYWIFNDARYMAKNVWKVINSNTNSLPFYVSSEDVYTSPSIGGVYYGVGETLDEAIANLQLSPQTKVKLEIANIYGLSSSCKYTNVENSSFKNSNKVYDFQYNLYEQVTILKSTSSILDFNLEILDFSFGKHKLAVKAKGPGYYDSDFSNVVEYTHTKKYAISYNATNATIEDVDGGAAMEKVYDSRPLSVKIQPAAGYLQPDTVTVTMNGAALSSSQYKYYPENGNLVIYSVTGDVEITAQGIKKVASPAIERYSGAEDIDYPLAVTFIMVDNASDYTLYINGAETAAVTTYDGNAVMMKVSSDAFTTSGTTQVYVVAEPASGYTASSPSNRLDVFVTLQVKTPVAVVRDDLKTTEYPFVCSVTKPAHSGNLQAWINGNYCGNVMYETDTNGDWIAYFPTSVFDGSSDSYEIYFVALGATTDIVDSDSSNRLVFGISKLSAPVIRLE